VLWRQVPPWLLEHLLALVPPDDRTPERRIFPGLNEGTMRDAIGRASRAAKLPLYSHMIFAIAAGRFGMRPGCPPESWRSGWVTRSRR
jgi:hypothetical protein